MSLAVGPAKTKGERASRGNPGHNSYKEGKRDMENDNWNPYQNRYRKLVKPEPAYKNYILGGIENMRKNPRLSMDKQFHFTDVAQSELLQWAVENAPKAQQQRERAKAEACLRASRMERNQMRFMSKAATRGGGMYP